MKSEILFVFLQKINSSFQYHSLLIQDIMEQSTIFQICGLVASVCMILGYLPQAIETIRTRKTDGIALPTFLMTGVGSIAFMIQGLLNEPNIIWSLVLTNFVTTICSCIVFGIKIYNYYFKDSRSKQPS